MSLLDRLSTKLKNIIARGFVHLVDGSGDVRRVQASFLGETDTLDGLPAPQDYGHASWPPGGLPCLGQFPGGDRSAGVVPVIVDNRYRPPHGPGDSVLYDHRGQRVHLGPEGIDIITPGRLRLIAEDIEIHAGTSLLRSVGGYADRMTHVSEGQLIAEIWNAPAVVTAEPDHHYPHPAPETSA